MVVGTRVTLELINIAKISKNWLALGHTLKIKLT